MEISFEEVKEIVETLPIGLYAHRRVPITLDREAQTSFYEPFKDCITFAYNNVVMALQNIKTTEYYTKETAIRSVAYHELSHALLTPNVFAKGYVPNICPADVFNIFEDERIETILKDFYLDVNFKKNIFAICGGKISQPTNADEGFFNLVRFRMYQNTPFADTVNQIIEKYKDITSATLNPNDENSWENSRHVWDYVNDINILYTNFKDNFSNLNNSNLQQEIEQKEKELSLDSESDGNYTEDVGGQGERDSKNPSDNEEENSNGNGGTDNSDEKNKTKAKDGGDASANGEPNPHGEGVYIDVHNVFEGVLNQLVDNHLTESLEAIIGQFHKKNNSGNGCYAYSGVFNPRNVAREDYRYFDKAISVNGNNRFGACHLNLFIDNSGSFCDNADRVNTLLKSLETISKRNKNFTFDVIKCGSDLKETTHKDMWITADEGTHAEYDEVKAIVKKHIKPNALNCSIVLYDGTVSYRGRNPFQAWDNKNTTLICDRTCNSEICKAKLTSAKHISIDDGNYVDRLTDEVTKAIAKAFT